MARRKDTAAALDRARAALAKTEADLADLVARYEETLRLSDDDASGVSLNAEMTKLRDLAKVQSDRVTVLAEQLKQEKAARRAKEREELITRIEEKLAQRESVGAELQKHMAEADQLFRRLIALSREISAAWPFPAQYVPACHLTGGAVLIALQHEIFRVGARPMLLGGQDGADAGLHFPGGKCPKLEWLQRPEIIPPLTDALKESSNFASSIMRGNRAIISLGQRQRTPAEERLAGLLVRQAQLAAADGNEDEYNAVVAEIRAATADVEAEKLPVN